MSVPLARNVVVVHANPLKSYGTGILLEWDGGDHARVGFRDGARMVRARDLTLEPAVPHVARPRTSVVYPRSAA